MSKMKTSYAKGCLQDKEQYHEIICGRISSNCLYCSIKMSDCPYWQERAKQKEPPSTNWKDYLLDFGGKK
jgi:hypothetical protein